MSLVIISLSIFSLLFAATIVPMFFQHEKGEEPFAPIPPAIVPFGKRTTAPHTKHISAHDLAGVNLKRRSMGERPMSRTGFYRAISEAPPYQQGSHLEFLMYLSRYKVPSPNYEQMGCFVNTGITIEPGQPYNGLGSSYERMLHK